MSQVIVLQVLTVRPDQATNQEEIALNVSLQPFRVNIDQAFITFLICAFKKNNREESEPDHPTKYYF